MKVSEFIMYEISSKVFPAVSGRNRIAKVAASIELNAKKYISPALPNMSIRRVRIWKTEKEKIHEKDMQREKMPPLTYWGMKS